MRNESRRHGAPEYHRIETLRGLACILVVAFHTVGAKHSGGMHVSDDSLYRQICEILVHLRMPLFTFLSGLVYAYRPVTLATWREFARHKLTRLLVPLVVVSTIYFACSLVLPYDKEAIPINQIWRIYVLPYNQYWFLQAMVIVFSAIALLDAYTMLTRVNRFMLIFVLASCASVAVTIEPDVFSLGHALHLMPFFLLGVAVIRFRGWFDNPWAVLGFTTVLLVTLTIHALGVFGVIGAVVERRSWVGLLIGCCGVLSLLKWFPVSGFFELIGGFSFTVYLYHAFFTAAARTLLKGLGQSSDEMMFVSGLILGIGGPILIERLLRPIPVARLTLLGQA